MGRWVRALRLANVNRMRHAIEPYSQTSLVTAFSFKLLVQISGSRTREDTCIDRYVQLRLLSEIHLRSKSEKE